MKIPFSWLKDYIDIRNPLEEILHRLTMLGLEVEGTVDFPAPDENLCCAEVLQVDPLSKSSNLKLCHINSGNSEFQVVCGAPNVKAGTKVVYAPAGTRLGDAVIQEKRFGEMVSQGMLCSEKDCGIGLDHSGLLILDPATGAGTPLKQIHPFEDTVIELGITPNRGDCLSIRGVARELAAAFNLEMKQPPLPQPFLASVDWQVHNKHPDLCPVYGGAILQDVCVVPSSLEIKYRLFLAGLRAINNVVDITNYMLLDLGQPMHAFDIDKLQGNLIQIRKAEAGESLRALDGETYQLRENDLVIADKEKPVALAGCIGGQDCAVTDETRHVFLESAAFAAGSVLRTARRLNLRTDSSFRFERGTDASAVPESLDRACAAIVASSGGTVASTRINLVNFKPDSRTVRLRASRCEQVLGQAFSQSDISNILSRIQLQDDKEDPEYYRIPGFRNDLEREIDLVEEVARVHGYDAIPEQVEMVPMIPAGNQSLFSIREKLKSLLSGMGLHECINYSFVSEKDLLDLQPLTGRTARPFILKNPLNPLQDTMRNSLLPGLIRNWVHSRGYQLEGIRLFETGTVFGQQQTEGLPFENNHIAMVLGGPVPVEGAGSGRRDLDWFDLKGFSEGFFAALNLPVVYTPEKNDVLNPCLSVSIDARCLGVIGCLSPTGQELFACKDSLFCGEFLIENIVESCSPQFQAVEVKRYPAINLDMSFLVAEQVSHQAILDIVEQSEIPVLEKITLFDVYRGKNIPKGRKSMAYSLTYRDAKETLKTETVNRFHEKIKEELARRVDAEFR